MYFVIKNYIYPNKDSILEALLYYTHEPELSGIATNDNLHGDGQG